MRVEKKCLFAMKRLLLSWGWEAFEVRVDLESSTLSIASTQVVQVRGHDKAFDVVFSGDWKERLMQDDEHMLENDFQC